MKNTRFSGGKRKYKKSQKRGGKSVRRNSMRNSRRVSTRRVRRGARHHGGAGTAAMTLSASRRPGTKLVLMGPGNAGNIDIATHVQKILNDLKNAEHDDKIELASNFYKIIEHKESADEIMRSNKFSNFANISKLTKWVEDKLLTPKEKTAAKRMAKQ